MIYETAVVGGGASGLIAAVAAAAYEKDVIVLEKNDRVGKKILATGNGRCNFTNTDISEKNYYGLDPGFVSPALSSFGHKETIEFFEKLGIHAKTEKGGRTYPYSGQASAVLDVLRAEAARLKVEAATGFNIERIQKKNDYFTLIGNEGKITAKSVIIAAGGCASPNFGSDGSGFKLLESVGHPVTPLYPALVQLTTDDGIAKALQGIKFDGTASLWVNGKNEATEHGEILFTAYGVSGPPILQLSGKAAGCKDIWLTLDLIPEYSREELLRLLERRKSDLSHVKMEDFFVGLLNKKLGQAVSKRAGIEKLSLPVSALTGENLRDLTGEIKALKLKLTGDNGWNNAQVTAGGAKTDFFSPYTMESKLIKNLYAVGEVLDIFGDCGGYNLQWAWSSGYAAGRAAAGCPCRTGE